MVDKPGPTVAGARAGKLAQLLADTMLAVSPHVQHLAETERAKFKEEFLEGLEQHTAKLVNPLLASVAESATIPPELSGLLEELGMPTEQFTGIISQFFIFGLMFNLGQSMLAPFIQQVQNDIWKANPDRPLSPPDLAVGAVRGIVPGGTPIVNIPDELFAIANESGISNEDFQFIADIGGQPPSPQELFEMFRREIITEDQVALGLKEGDARDEWIADFQKLAYSWMTPLDFVRAAVQAQMDPADAETWAGKTGLDTSTAIPGLTPPNGIPNNMFGLAYSIAGRPPGPEEVAHMALRGIVPWTGTGADALTFEQAIAESDIKTKWTSALKALATYYPPIGEIRTLLVHGGITEADALSYWAAQGVPADLAKAYLHLAQVEQVTTDKALAKGDILTLVQEQAISDDEAESLLANIGYSGQNATYLIQMAHFRYELESLRAAIRKVSSLYVSRKVTATQAKAAFSSIGLPDAQITSLFETLDVQRDTELPTLAKADITAAVYYGVIDADTGIADLVALGYSETDAYIVLSNRLHSPLPNPPAGLNPPGLQTPPATTATTS